jgi:hypothetical protein
MRWTALICMALLTTLTARAQPGPALAPAQSAYHPEAETVFESRLADRVAGRSTQTDLVRDPAPDNSRGLALKGQDAAIIGLTVTGRKYGVSLDNTGEVLIKNFVFRRRQSQDIYGSGLILGQSAPTRGETWLSNAWIDLEGKGQIPDYKLANNEAVTVEAKSGRLNIRKAVLLGGEESGLDNKGSVRIDASFIASGHRSIRVWAGARVVVANSIILAYPGFTGLWFGGGKGEAKFEYYNCRFGAVGDSEADLVSDPPGWMLQTDDDDAVAIRLKRLDKDPFDRSRSSFWVSANAPVPRGYLAVAR